MKQLNIHPLNKTVWEKSESEISFVPFFSFFFLFDLCFMASQDYFTHFAPNQSLGGAEMGDP